MESSSGGPTSWTWDFGDGTTSSERNPIHAFSTSGFRKVTLTVAAGTASKRASRTVPILPATANATFVFSPMTPSPGQTVQFADTTAGSPTSWSWNFGDGATSTVKNPSHVYRAAGTYSVTLAADTDTGTKQGTQSINVSGISALDAAFSYTPSAPVANKSIQFTDMSTGSPTSWLWSFGDGMASTARHPIHVYSTAGSKAVTLTVTNSGGSNVATQTVIVGTELAASFTFSPTSAVAGQSVQFTDTSTGSPTSWAWNFGDGGTSTVRNPSHAFTTAGSKTVTLTVTNSGGSNAATQTVTVGTALAASFTFSPTSAVAGQSVQFTDTSTGSPTSWAWNFGDGGTSTVRNPSHTFATAGSKTVTLTVTNSTGSKSASRTVPVLAALTASFTFSPASPAIGQSVQFTDASIGTPTNWQWNFGDGTTSVAQNPSHGFASAGSYTVTLTIMNSSTSNTTSRAVVVGSAVVASFSYSPTTPTEDQSVQFTDTSTGSPTSWSWNFGDGTTSTLRNPSHVFTTSGSYNVSLTAATSSTSNTTSRLIAVTPVTTLDASFSYSPSAPAPDRAVAFTDTSTGTPTSWQWNFGDGGTSTAQNPSHSYAAEGSYSVTLIARNASGSDTVSRTVTVAESSDIVPAERLYDWGAYCGIPGGIPQRTTIFRTLSPGATAADINAAIASCPAGQVVYLSAGTFSLGTGQIRPERKTGVTVRGAGPGKTIIRSSTTNVIRQDGYAFNEADGISITGGFSQGSRSIVLASAPSSRFTAGGLIAITENSSPNKFASNVGVYARDGLTTSVPSLTASRCFRFVTRITGVSGNTISLATPLPLNFTASLNPKAYPQSGTGVMSMFGIEDMTFDGCGDAIRLYETDRCWFKNLEFKNCPGNDIGHIQLYNSVQPEIRGCYVHDVPDWPGHGRGNGFRGLLRYLQRVVY